MTYVSLAVAILLTTMYLGQWQINAWKVLYSSFFGTLLGIVCIQLWSFKIIYTLMFFLSILAINKCTLWDQFAKIFGGLSFVIAAFTAVSGMRASETFVVNLLMMNVPSLIVGISLVLPPALAAHSCVRKVRSIQKHLGYIGTMYGYAVCHPDFANMYLYEAETATTDVAPLLSTLSSLVAAVESEAMLFPALTGMPESLRVFIAAAQQILVEFENMRCIHSRIVFNSTHAHIMSVLEADVKDSLASVATALQLAAECIAIYPDNVLHKRIFQSSHWKTIADNIQRLLDPISKWFNLWCRMESHVGTEDSCETAAMQWRPSHYLSVLMTLSTRDSAPNSHSKNISANNMEEARRRKESVASNRTNRSEGEPRPAASQQEALEELHEECLRLGDLRAALSRNVKAARERYLFRTDRTPFTNEVDSSCSDNTEINNEAGASSKLISLQGLKISLNNLNHPDEAEILRNEYLNLGVRNLVPRGAYILHLTFVVSEILALEASLATISYSVNLDEGKSAAHDALDFRSAAINSMRRAYQYLWSIFSAFLNILKELIHSYICPAHLKYGVKGISFKEYVSGLFKGYLHPFKIALAGTLCALLVIVPSWWAANPYGSWAAVVVMIVRQDSSSSSYLRGYQRLEGTVVGAVFSFALIKVFSGIHDNQFEYVVILHFLIVLWVGVCAYFREVVTHGYSAAVAALTPAVLVIGNLESSNLESIAWSRVSMTFYGVMVYLLIDNAICPTRSDALVRGSTKDLICDIRSTVIGCKLAMKELFSLGSSIEGFHSPGGNVDAMSESLPISCCISPLEYDGRMDEESIVEKARIIRAESQDSSMIGSGSSDRGLPSSGDVASGSTPADLSFIMLQVFARCRHNIQDEVFVRILSLKSKLDTRRGQIALTDFEPKLWHKNFPQSAYKRLQAATERAETALEAVASSILHLCTTLAAMPMRNSSIRGSIAVENLILVGDMTSSLLEVSDLADIALGSVVDNISR